MILKFEAESQQILYMVEPKIDRCGCWLLLFNFYSGGFSPGSFDDVL